MGRKKKVTFIPTKYRPPKPADVMAFPDWVISGFADRFSDAYSEILEPPPYAFYMAALTCLGSMLSGSVRLKIGIKTDPRLYTVFLGESGVTKKSTSATTAVNFFRDTFRNDFQSTLGVGSAEGLAAVLTRGRWNNRTILFYDEFKQFVDKCRSKGSTLLTCVTELFESNYYENTTKAAQVKFDDAHLTIMAASTYDTYAQCWDKEFTDIGFSNRVFVVPIEVTEPLYGMPPIINPSIYKSLQEEALEIINETKAGIVYDVDPYARDYYESWYMDRQRVPETVRLDTYALRLMPLLTANDRKFMVDIDTVRKAIALVEWQGKVRGLRSPLVVDNKYAEMEARVRRVLNAKGGSLSHNELRRYCNADYFGLRIFDDALKMLINAKDIEVTLKGQYRIVNNRG